MSSTNKNIVIGGPGRLIRFSFAHVLEPEKNKLSGKEEYSVMLLIPKTDKKSVQIIKAELKRFMAEIYGKNPPRNLELPLKDGDDYYSSNTGEQDKNRFGCYYLTARTQFPPEVKKLVARKLLDAKGEDDFYSGCYGIAAINFYNYDTMGKKGISAGLSSVCKIKDGERLGGGKPDAEKDFSEFDFADFDADQDSFEEEDVDGLDIDSDELPF